MFSVMKEQNFKEEVTKTLQEAPNARRALLENYDNLLNVADYCYNNYLQSDDSSTVTALEETKNFTTQSLASVAYQISTLANSVLTLLDAQTNQLQHMESSINLIGQTVEMHKEKVSRREIGTFTVVRRVPRSHKLLPPSPAGTQPRPPYSRRPINYQQLDSLGHGVKVSGKQTERPGMMRKHGASVRSTKPPEPVQCPVAPPVSGSSFGKPVAPPTAPVTWQASSECDIITTLPDDAPPLPAQDLQVVNMSPPPPPPPPAVAPPTLPPPPTVTDDSTTALAPPLILETVEEHVVSLPPPPPPPAADENTFPLPANECQELPAPPPPPPVSQEAEVMIPPPPPYPPPLAPPPSLSSSSSPRICLPARLDHLDLEILAPPPSFLLDDDRGFDDIIISLPPPVDYDMDAPPHYLDEVVAQYDYEASKPDELTFTEGDIIYLIHRHDNGWWEGIVNGNRGFFPQNFVQSSSTHI
ncbi:ABI family, member 3a isoform X2 [Genypterus blacodes]|uniref:ABI family, member 3a isoform X2 n=1 Tax=Genypterus blacodes TaxID=154954 RepID=UPI003F776270